MKLTFLILLGTLSGINAFALDATWPFSRLFPTPFRTPVGDITEIEPYYPDYHPPAAGGLPQAHTICGSQVVNRPGIDATPVLQNCIDSTTLLLELVPGEYAIDSTLFIYDRQGLTLQTQGVSASGNEPACLSEERAKRRLPHCAVLKASARNVQSPILASKNSTGLRFLYIAIDGNHDQRLGPVTDRWHPPMGYNSMLFNCTDCQFVGLASVRALKGTAMEYQGYRAVFDRVLFKDNGYGFANYTRVKAVADGLTLLSGPGVRITNSEFSDNSDINLVIGNAPGGRIENNFFNSRGNRSNAGIMLDNFDNTTRGDYTGAVVQDNTIDCGPGFVCGMGISVGPHLWYASTPITGGLITRNRIRRVKQGIAINGATGTVISQNSIDLAGGFSSGKHLTSFVDIEDGSSVQLESAVSPTRNRLKGSWGAAIVDWGQTSYSRSILIRDFVAQVYGNFLNRRPAPDEVKTLASGILNGDFSPAAWLWRIQSSPEMLSSVMQGGLPRIYERCLGRAPDPEGLQHYARYPLAKAAREICTGDYPEHSRYFFELLVAEIYRECRGRPPTRSEMDSWRKTHTPERKSVLEAKVLAVQQAICKIFN